MKPKKAIEIIAQIIPITPKTGLEEKVEII
jgi:hypothetical protein